MRRHFPLSLIAGTMCTLLAVTGCEELTGPPNGEIAIRNALSDTVAVSAWDLEVSNRIDLAASPPPRATLGETLLAPGKTRLVPVEQIPGYERGSGLRVFTWRVRGDTVQFGPSFTMTYEQLKQSDFTIDLAIATIFR